MSKIRNPVVSGPINQKIAPPPVQGLEEHEITANISVPKEGGWGWVVVAAAFLMIFILDGTIFTFGSMMVDMAEDFKETNTLMSLVNSVASSLYLLMSPLASGLINRFGFRICAMTGSSLCAFSLLASHFIEKYAYLMFFYGVCNGIGTALINMSASLIVGFYFEKLRAFAMAITNCGASFGVMVMFPLNSYLVSLAGWRSTILFQSGLFGISYFLGLTFRPLLSVSVSPEQEGVPLRSVVYLPSVTTVGPRQSATVPAAHASERLLRTLSNKNFPTAAAVVDSAGGALTPALTTASTTASTSAPSTSQDIKEIPQEEKPSKIVLTPNMPSGSSHRHLKQVKSIASTTGVVVQLPGPNAEADEPKGFWERVTDLDTTPERPLYRDDAFYDGDIKRLPEYQKNVDEASPQSKTGLEYQMAVTRAASMSDLEERRGVFTTAVRRVLVTMMDPVLLKSKPFLLICISGFCVCSGFYVPYVYLKDRNIHKGMDSSQCSILMSILAVSNAVGRLGLGTAAAKINPLSLYAASLTAAGVSTMISNLSYKPAYQFFYASVFGFSIAAIASLRSLCLVYLFGLDKLTNATGMMMLFLGFGSVISTPLAGFIKSTSGAYDLPFIVAGGFMTVGGIIALFLRIMSKKPSDMGTVKEKPKKKRVQQRKVRPKIRMAPSVEQPRVEKPKLDNLDPAKYEKYSQEKSIKS